MCRKSTFLVILGWSCCNHIYLVSTLSKYQNNDKVFDWKSEHQANLHNVLMIEKAIALPPSLYFRKMWAWSQSVLKVFLVKCGFLAGKLTKTS